MSEDITTDFVLVDAIASEAYVLTMITCLHCERDLMAADLGIDVPSDPMEAWAQKFRVAAIHEGWSVTSTGSIVCPECRD